MMIAFTLLFGMLPLGSIKSYGLEVAVCSIDEMQYATLDEALAVVQTGETIKLLQDINYNKGIQVDGKTITFDLGSFTLNIMNNSGSGLEATGSSINLTGTGQLNATGTDYGIYSDNSTVTVNNARGESGTGAYATNGGIITANGIVSGSSIGAHARGLASKIYVNGDAGGPIAVRANEGGMVHVTGSVNGWQACYATGEGSIITIDGNVTGNGDSRAVYAEGGGTISVTGDVVGKNGSYAIYAERDSEITVIGNVTGDKMAIYSGGNATGKYGEVNVIGNVNGGTIGAYAIYGGRIHIDGNVEGWDVGASCNHGNIFVSGDVKGKYAVSAESGKNEIIIEGDVISDWTDGHGVSISGSKVFDGTNIAGTVRIDGAIRTKGRYIEINGVVKDGSPESRNLDTTLDGYHTYSEESKTPIVVGGSEFATSVVWVKEVTEPSEKVCSIGSKQYASLDVALAELETGQTIKILKNINHNKGITIDGKNITFDVGSFILNVTSNSGSGLEVKNLGSVALMGSGEFNVETTFQTGCGVLLSGKSSATVTNIKATGKFGYGAYATNIGDYLNVLGNILVTHTDGYAHGVRCWDGGYMVIDGTLTTPYGWNYIAFGTASMSFSEGVPDPDKPGYIKYSWPDHEGAVWIKNTTPSQVGQTFSQISEGVPLYYKILTDEPGKQTVELIWNKGYVGRTAFTVPKTVTYKDRLYTITSIGDGAFYNCKLATSITVPESVTNIGDGAFKECQLLEGFMIPPLVNKIGEEAFAYCAKLSSIIIPGGVTRIEAKTFRACGITSMSIPIGVTSIGVAAFDACGLLANIIIPQSVTNIGAAAFNQCSSLKTITIPNQVTRIETGTFNGCNNLTDINIHANITDIGKESFMGCESLTNIHIPTSARSIEDSTFAGCKSLTTIDIPNGVKSIGEWAFSGCENITTISFPAGVTNIGYGAFSECTKLKSVTFLQQNPPSFGSKSFHSSVTTIYVALGCTAKYQPYTGEGSTFPNARIIELGAYILTVGGSYSGNTGAGNYSQGAKVTINAGTRSGYSFAGWTSADGITFTNKNSATTTFTMPAKNVTITAEWSQNSGSSSGGNSGGGGSNSGGNGGGSYSSSTTTIITIVPEKNPGQPVTAAVPVTVTVDVNGMASTNISDKTVMDAIARAQADAKIQGKISNGIAMMLNVAMPQGATSLSVIFSQIALQSLVNAEIVNLDINGAPVSINFDSRAIKAIQSQSSGNVTIKVVPVRNTSSGAKKMIGSRPMYDIIISYIKDSKMATISAFEGGIATISIPYTPEKGEVIRYLHGVYVDNKGNATRIQGSGYDANAGAVLIPTDHLSMYGVGYTDISTKFTDISSHWAKEAIDYVVGRGLISGTKETTFAPSASMTRGILVTALGRLHGVDTKLYTTNSFTDVKVESEFCPYIEWAYENGIVQGKGSNKFDPDCDITREEIAVILERYGRVTGYYLPIIHEAAIYSDNSSIGSIYQTAVKAMQQAGIMMGGTGNKFNPKSSATRAEVATMLHRYINLTINPITAQGWVLNDTGQYLYYRNNKALTGGQIINGVKYFFETNGTLKTDWVKDGDNWRFYSGNRMLVGWCDIGNGENQKTYYFYTDGLLAKNTKINDYEVDENGVRKAK